LESSPTKVDLDAVTSGVRGYEIRFKDGGRKISLVRFDMTNVEELIRVLASRLKAARDSQAVL
jgi:hypothetical protein